jgi:hypothetical protein
MCGGIDDDALSRRSHHPNGRLHLGAVESPRPCTREEHDTWVRHQRLSNPNSGDWLIELYRKSGSLELSAVTGATQIGRLTSFFKTTDPAAAVPTRLTVCEALELFTARAAAGGPDAVSRCQKIRDYVGRTKRPDSVPLVTAVRFLDGLVLIDGNHTAMAAYLRAAESRRDAYVLPLFVLRTDQSAAILG